MCAILHEHTLTKKRTIVNYSLLWFKTMVLWNFDLLRKNYGTMEKTMVLWKRNIVLLTKLWFFTENYGIYQNN